ncbi:MAG: hypothetical protein Q7T55_17630, partial [Solirubrobacteraceae bacterium]|nr:hypothetical protein [Solirubrobacteraceae bacterium]
RDLSVARNERDLAITNTAELDAGLGELQRRIVDLGERAQAQAREEEKLRQELAIATRAQEHAEARADTLATERDIARSRAEQITVALEERASAARDEEQSHTRSVDQLTTRIHELEERIRRIDTGRGEIEASLTEREIEVERLTRAQDLERVEAEKTRKELEAAHARADEIVDQLAAIRGEREGAMLQSEDRAKRIADLESQLRTAEEQVGVQRVEAARQADRIDELELSNDRAQAGLIGADETEAERRRLRTELDAANEAYEHLQARYVELERKSNEDRDRQAALRAELGGELDQAGAVAVELTAARDDLEVRDQALAETRARLEESERARASLDAELGELRDDLAQLQAVLEDDGVLPQRDPSPERDRDRDRGRVGETSAYEATSSAAPETRAMDTFSPSAGTSSSAGDGPVTPPATPVGETGDRPSFQPRQPAPQPEPGSEPDVPSVPPDPDSWALLEDFDDGIISISPEGAPDQAVDRRPRTPQPQLPEDDDLPHEGPGPRKYKAKRRFRR